MLETVLVGRFMVFTFVLARIGGVVALAPLFGMTAIPARVRILLAMGLALVVTPVFYAASASPTNLSDYSWRMANEILVGLMFGLGIAILFMGARLAGQLVGQLSGLAIDDLFDPQIEAGSSIFSQLYFWVAMAVFVAIGGHRWLTGAVLETFVMAPPGHVLFSADFLPALVNVVTQSFGLGIRAVAPVMIALLLTTILLNLVSRTLPQINTMTVGLSLNALVALGATCVSIGVVAWTFPEQAEQVIAELQEVIQK